MFQFGPFGGSKKAAPPSDPAAHLAALSKNVVDDPSILNQNLRDVCGHLGTALHDKADQCLSAMVAMHASRMLSTLWTVLMQRLRETQEARSQLSILKHFSTIADRISIPQRAGAFKAFTREVSPLFERVELVADRAFGMAVSTVLRALGAHADAESCEEIFSKALSGVFSWSRLDARRAGAQQLATLVGYSTSKGTFRHLLEHINSAPSLRDDIVGCALMLDSTCTLAMEQGRRLQTPAAGGQHSTDTTAPQYQSRLMEAYKEFVMSRLTPRVQPFAAADASMVDPSSVLVVADVTAFPMLVSSFSKIRSVEPSWVPAETSTILMPGVLNLLRNPKLKRVLVCPLLSFLKAMPPPPSSSPLLDEVLLVIESLCVDQDSMVRCEAFGALEALVPVLPTPQVTRLVELSVEQHRTYMQERCNMTVRGLLGFVAAAFPRILAPSLGESLVHQLTRAHLDMSNTVTKVPAVQWQLLSVLEHHVTRLPNHAIAYLFHCVFNGDTAVRGKAIRVLVALCHQTSLDPMLLQESVPRGLDFLEGVIGGLSTSTMSSYSVQQQQDSSHQPHHHRHAHLRNFGSMLTVCARQLTNASSHKELQSVCEMVRVFADASQHDANGLQPEAGNALDDVTVFSPVLSSRFSLLLRLVVDIFHGVVSVPLDVACVAIDTAASCARNVSPVDGFDVFFHKSVFNLVWNIVHLCCSAADPINCPKLHHEPSLYLSRSATLHHSWETLISQASSSALSSSERPQETAFYKVVESSVNCLVALARWGRKSPVFVAHLRHQYKFLLVCFDILASTHPVQSLDACREFFVILFCEGAEMHPTDILHPVAAAKGVTLQVSETVPALQRTKFAASTTSILNRSLAFDLVHVGVHVFRTMRLFIAVDTAARDTSCYRSIDETLGLFKRMAEIIRDPKYYNAVHGSNVPMHVLLTVLQLYQSPHASEVEAILPLATLCDDVLNVIQSSSDAIGEGVPLFVDCRELIRVILEIQPSRRGDCNHERWAADFLSSTEPLLEADVQLCGARVPVGASLEVLSTISSALMQHPSQAADVPRYWHLFERWQEAVVQQRRWQYDEPAVSVTEGTFLRWCTSEAASWKEVVAREGALRPPSKIRCLLALSVLAPGAWAPVAVTALATGSCEFTSVVDTESRHVYRALFGLMHAYCDVIDECSNRQKEGLDRAEVCMRPFIISSPGCSEISTEPTPIGDMSDGVPLPRVAPGIFGEDAVALIRSCWWRWTAPSQHLVGAAPPTGAAPTDDPDGAFWTHYFPPMAVSPPPPPILRVLVDHATILPFDVLASPYFWQQCLQIFPEEPTVATRRPFHHDDPDEDVSPEVDDAAQSTERVLNALLALSSVVCPRSRAATLSEVRMLSTAVTSVPPFVLDRQTVESFLLTHQSTLWGSPPARSRMLSGALMSWITKFSRTAAHPDDDENDGASETTRGTRDVPEAKEADERQPAREKSAAEQIMSLPRHGEALARLDPTDVSFSEGCRGIISLAADDQSQSLWRRYFTEAATFVSTAESCEALFVRLLDVFHEVVPAAVTSASWLSDVRSAAPELTEMFVAIANALIRWDVTSLHCRVPSVKVGSLLSVLDAILSQSDPESEMTLALRYSAMYFVVMVAPDKDVYWQLVLDAPTSPAPATAAAECVDDDWPALQPLVLSVLRHAVEAPPTATLKDVSTIVVSIFTRSAALSAGIQESILWMVTKCCSLSVWSVVLSGEVGSPTELASLRFLCKLSQTVGTSHGLAQEMHARYTPLLLSFGSSRSELDPDEQRMVFWLITSVLLHTVISEERHTKPKPHISLADALHLYVDYPLASMSQEALVRIREQIDVLIFPAHIRTPARHSERNWNPHTRGHLLPVGGRQSLSKAAAEKMFTSILHMYAHVVHTVFDNVQQMRPEAITDVFYSLSILSAGNASLLKHSPALEGTIATGVLQKVYGWYRRFSANTLAAVDSKHHHLSFRVGLFPESTGSLDFTDTISVGSCASIICSLYARGNELLPGAVDVSFILEKLLCMDIVAHQTALMCVIVMSGTSTRKELSRIAPLCTQRLFRDLDMCCRGFMSISFAVLQLLRSAFSIMTAIPDDQTSLKVCEAVWSGIVVRGFGGRRVQHYAHFMLQSMISMASAASDPQWKALRSLVASGSRELVGRGTQGGPSRHHHLDANTHLSGLPAGLHNTSFSSATSTSFTAQSFIANTAATATPKRSFADEMRSKLDRLMDNDTEKRLDPNDAYCMAVRQVSITSRQTSNSAFITTEACSTSAPHHSDHGSWIAPSEAGWDGDRGCAVVGGVHPDDAGVPTAYAWVGGVRCGEFWSHATGRLFRLSTCAAAILRSKRDEAQEDHNRAQVMDLLSEAETLTGVSAFGAVQLVVIEELLHEVLDTNDAMFVVLNRFRLTEASKHMFLDAASRVVWRCCEQQRRCAKEGADPQKVAALTGVAVVAQLTLFLETALGRHDSSEEHVWWVLVALLSALGWTSPNGAAKVPLSIQLLLRRSLETAHLRCLGAILCDHWLHAKNEPHCVSLRRDAKMLLGALTSDTSKRLAQNRDGGSIPAETHASWATSASREILQWLNAAR